MDDLLVILASVTVVSLISFVGILFVGLKTAFINRILMALVGFASGSMIGAVFFNLLPEALTGIDESGTVFLLQLVVIGIVFFFVMEKFLYWRHCHDEKCQVHSFAYLNLMGDGVHNFVDGMAIAAAFFVSYPLGFATTLAVVFHEIPQELGDFGVLIYGGFEKKKALTYNFISALSAVAGAMAVYWLDIYVHGFERFLIPFAAGGFIYVAATDLMPQLHKETHAKESLVQLFSLLAGIGLMLVLAVLLPNA